MGEGMPTLKNPMIQGNLFLILNIEFPESLQSETQHELRKLLPPPLNSTSTTEDDDVEVHTLSDIDPVQSYKSNQVNMDVGGEAYDEDPRQGPQGAAPSVHRCNQTPVGCASQTCMHSQWPQCTDKAFISFYHCFYGSTTYKSASFS